MTGTAMRVTFAMTPGRMATAMAIVARDSDDLLSYSADSYGPEPAVFRAFVNAMTRAEAREALRTCYWRYGEGDCWPGDWPTNARLRAYDIVVERGWAT